ncbi:beta-glucuronidase [Spirochaetia bacterium]|nr:beta-glucuronidase [Spirochaetia bacterium]
MSDNKGNYQADIHNAGYEQEYHEKLLDSAGLINTVGRETESLNGKWNFGVDLYDTCRRAHWHKDIQHNEAGMLAPVDYDWEAWERITVPASWNLERPELHYFEGSGIYTRTFRYIKQDKDERLFLRFEGSAYETSVFLNGEFVGTHDGSSTPFNADISGLVKTENRIVVAADARRSSLRVPMENTDWFNYGGIYRSVYLIRLPRVFIKDWFVRLVPNGTFSKINADILLDSDTAAGKALIEIPELGIRQEVSLQSGKASLGIPVKPGQLKLWSPETPKLYDVKISYIPSGTDAADTVSDRIGFREIKTKGAEIFLNGKKVFLKGVCLHEDHLTLGKTATEELIRSAIRDLKELHGNYFRLAHYPHDSRFAKIADEEGVLLWEEVPVYWAVAFDNPGTYKDAENQLAELILRDRNRASVIIWSVGNENADTEDRLSFMSNLAKKARSLDDSRLVSAACLINHDKLKIEDRLADSLDIIGINEYYGWYDPDFSKLPKILANSDPGKPVVICEFGGDARKGQRGSVDDLFTEDKQKRLYEQQIETFKQCAYIAGTTPWILYDFRCPRRLNRYQEGFNRKGLIDADRKTRKLAFYVMQEYYKEQ